MIRFTILGEPASKANSIELSTRVKFSSKRNKKVTVPSMRKSDKARDYERTAQAQIPAEARQRLQGPVRVTMHVFYRTQLPDLDCSVILDVLQTRYIKVIDRYEPLGDGQFATIKVKKLVNSGVYDNDRQVREMHFFHHIDKLNPRAEIEVELLEVHNARRSA